MIFQILKSILISGLIAVLVLLMSVPLPAQQMNLPKDELAQESVYPLFDNPKSVRNRNIKDASTFDVGIFGGMAITEPIANTSKFGLSLNYHLSEAHALGLIYAKNSTGLSKDAQGLKNDFGLDFTRAPYPEYSLMADYNYKMYYGKLSVTKNGVINTSIYVSAAAGMIKYIHKSYPAVAFGIGERFYFTDHLALKLDLRLFLNNAPSPFKAGALREGIDPVPSYNDFSDKMTYTTNLELGLNYLF